jgi:hypothetical protein
MSLKYITKRLRLDVLFRKPGLFLSISVLTATLVRILYSGWFSPFFVYPMRGDGVRSIFSGIDGYFLPGPMRLLTVTHMPNNPYISTTFYYSIFHPLCMTRFLGVALSAAAHISVICIILLSLRMFNLSAHKKVFALLLIITVFNWAPFYEGVLQGFPPEFLEVLGIIFGFYLFLKGRLIPAGIVFGLTATIKVLPVIFIVYFLYKKQFRLVVTAVITCLILSAIIIWKENINLISLNYIISFVSHNAAYGRGTRDFGLNAFIDFVFHNSLGPDLLSKIHCAALFLLALYFMAIERLINLQKNKYLFGLAAISLAMFQFSPHISEMYCYILLLPALFFNIWMLIIYRDKLFGVTFILSYIFMHGFSLLNIFFRILTHLFNSRVFYGDIYELFNVHGGIFIGAWLLYFSTYGLALKYLVGKKKIE